MKIGIGLPSIPASEQTPAMKLLLGVIEHQQSTIQQQAEQIARLEEEIKRLKRHKGKPHIKASQMNKDKSDKRDSSKRAGSEKRHKNAELTIHEEKIIAADNVPCGSRFKGYQDYIVQDLLITASNTCYRLERWQLLDGSYHVASLPADVEGYHFGASLRSFVDYQYHHQQVTQPLLLEQLRDYGIDISAGELNHLLTENKEPFHEEKREILAAGLEVSRYIHVDDTGARHAGKNGYCTQIGNELFAWFESTDSKSRINFLELLRQGHNDYVVNADALNYMKKHKLPREPLHWLQGNLKSYADSSSWESHLDKLGIRVERHRRIATEGALIGCLASHGFFMNLIIMSDDAGQFNILRHILCWVHCERKINELIPLHDGHVKDIAHIRSLFWEIYDMLKAYKKSPTEASKIEIEKKFEALCAMKTSYQLLNNVLKRLHQNKKELLLVLDHPWLPLHNNLSEGDIREYVKKRKVSGGTRSEEGRRSRDTFASLKKTCRKLKINFWNYLYDRHSKKFAIPPIAKLIKQAAIAI
jgi:hypothetical protein